MINYSKIIHYWSVKNSQKYLIKKHKIKQNKYTI